MVYANVLQSVRAVLEGMFKLDIPLGSEKARVRHEIIDTLVTFHLFAENGYCHQRYSIIQ